MTSVSWLHFADEGKDETMDSDDQICSSISGILPILQDSRIEYLSNGRRAPTIAEEISSGCDLTAPSMVW